MRLLLALLFAPLLLLPAAGSAQDALPQGVARVTTVEGITEYNLPNGLRVLFAPDASKPTTTVNITYLVGSRHENYGETGMAHLLEHLFFFGTPAFPDAKQQRLIRGMRANGTTWTDRTNYFASWAANDDNLDWFLRWSADAMTNSFIAKKDLDTEMTVVRNELESGENDPAGVLTRRALAVAFDWHNYGKSTIGTRADLENVKIERLQAFYRKYYQPDNAVLTVTGKFDEAKTLALIAREFGRIPRPARVLEPTYTVDPEQQGDRTVVVRRVGDTQLALALYHVPAGPHPDFAAVQLLARILGDTPSGRLHKALVETRQAASVAAFAFAWREPSVVGFRATVPQTASLDNARATLLSVVEEIARSPITDAELESARARLLRDFDLQASDPERVGVALSNAIAQGDWRLFFLQRDRVRQARTADVQRVAESYLLPDNRTLGLFIPTAAPKRPPAPQLVDVAPMVRDYKGDAAVAAGEAFDATPANIDARTERGATADGLRYALLPKRTRGGVVSVRLQLRMGDEKSLFGTPPTGSITAAMLERGAAGMTRRQVQEELERLRSRVAFAGGSTRATVSIETTGQNLPRVMELVARMLRQPDFPAAELEQLKLERVTALEAQKTQPDALARNALARHGNPYPRGDVRHDATLDEAIADLKAVTLERVRAFHRDFYGIGNAELSAVGDFDAAALKAQLATLYAGFRSARPYTRVPTPAYPLPPAQVRLETPDRANAFFAAQARFALRDDAPDHAPMLVANRIVGGGVSASLLYERIRTREGISYGVGSTLAVGSHEPNATWSAFAIYAPQNVRRLEDAFRDVLGRVAREGFTEQQLRDAKNGLLQARRLSLAQDGELAQALAAQLELGRTMAYVAAVDRAIEAVTLEEANAAFRKHVDLQKLVMIYAGDFAKARP